MMASRSTSKRSDRWKRIQRARRDVAAAQALVDAGTPFASDGLRDAQRRLAIACGVFDGMEGLDHETE
jgi:hypothetical protein